MAEVFKPSRGGNANFNLGRANPNIAMGMARAAETTHRQVLSLVDKQIDVVEEHIKQVDSENTIVNLEKLDAKMLEIAENKFTTPDPSSNLTTVERINQAFGDEIASMESKPMTSGARKLFRIGSGRNKASAMNLVIQRDLANKRAERSNKVILSFLQAGQSVYAFALKNPHQATQRTLEKFRQNQDLIYQAEYSAATLQKFQIHIRDGIEKGLQGLIVSDPRKALEDIDSGLYNDYTVGEEKRVYWGLDGGQQARLRAEAERAVAKLDAEDSANFHLKIDGWAAMIMSGEMPNPTWTMPPAPNKAAEIRGQLTLKAATDLQSLNVDIANRSPTQAQDDITKWIEYLNDWDTDPIYAALARPLLQKIIRKNSEFRKAYDDDPIGAGKAYSKFFSDSLGDLPWYSDRYQTIIRMYQDTMGVKHFNQRIMDNATVTDLGDRMGFELKGLPQHMGFEPNQLSSKEIRGLVASIAEEIGPERLTRVWYELGRYSKLHNFTSSQLWAFSHWQDPVKFHHLISIFKTNEAKLNENLGSELVQDITIKSSNNEKIKAFLSAIPNVDAATQFGHHITMVAKSMAIKNQDYNSGRAVDSAVELLFGDQRVLSIPLRGSSKNRDILIPNRFSDADVEKAIENLHSKITFGLLDALESEAGHKLDETLEKYVNDTFLLYNGRTNGFNIAYEGPFGPILVRDVDGAPILKDFDWFVDLDIPITDNDMANRKGTWGTGWAHFYNMLYKIPSPARELTPPNRREIKRETKEFKTKKNSEDLIKQNRKRISDANSHLKRYGNLDGTIFDHSQEEFMKITGLSADKTAILYRTAQEYITAKKLFDKQQAIFKKLKVSPPKHEATSPLPKTESTSLTDKMKNTASKFETESQNVPIQTDGSPETPPKPSIATVYKPMWKPPIKLKVVPKVSVGSSTLPEGWVGAPINKKEPKKDESPPKPKDSKFIKPKGDLEGGFKSPNPSKLPTTGLDKLSLAKLKKYTKDKANELGTADRKILRDLLKKKGASRKYIADVFGFGN